jgi:ceramide synthetase
MRVAMKNYYIFQFAYHSGEFISLVLLKNKEDNSKFWEYALHHFVAVALIAVSLTYNLVIIGIIVLLCHDPADIFIGCIELNNYYRCSCLLRI